MSDAATEAFQPQIDDDGYVVGPPNYADLVETCRYGNISSNARDIVEDMMSNPQMVLGALVEAGAVVEVHPDVEYVDGGGPFPVLPWEGHQWVIYRIADKSTESCT